MCEYKVQSSIYLFIYLSGLFITCFLPPWTSCFDPDALAHSGHLTLFTFRRGNVQIPCAFLRSVSGVHSRKPCVASRQLVSDGPLTRGK